MTFLRNPMLAAGVFLTGGLTLVALLGPIILHGDPNAQDLYAVLQPPTWTHPCGTDAFGRDIFLRLVSGARLSLFEVVACLLLAVSVGVPVGLMAGFTGGLTDAVLMWAMDVLFAFPGLVLAILAVAILGAGFGDAIASVALFTMPVYARLARNLAAGVRNLEYIQAARSLGVGVIRMQVLHVLPNIFPTVLVQATMSAGSVILSVSALSFLGLGAQPPLAEWGAMMSDGRRYLGADFWPSLFPGAAIALAVFGFNCLGEALKSHLDKR